MDDINKIVAKNLKDIREKKKLSLDKLSDLTDVSKSMLGQIERSESNPSIQTLWKIAKGLKISFTALIDQSKANVLFVKKGTISPILGDNGKFRIYPIFPFDEINKFEVLRIELDPNTSSFSEPHDDDTEEYVMVAEGEFTLKTDGKQYTLNTGDSIRYPGDEKHSYHNYGSKLVIIFMIIYYP